MWEGRRVLRLRCRFLIYRECCIAWKLATTPDVKNPDETIPDSLEPPNLIPEFPEELTPVQILPNRLKNRLLTRLMA
jgi:hypothetical protein